VADDSVLQVADSDAAQVVGANGEWRPWNRDSTIVQLQLVLA